MSFHAIGQSQLRERVATKVIGNIGWQIATTMYGHFSTLTLPFAKHGQVVFWHKLKMLVSVNGNQFLVERIKPSINK